MTLGQFRTITEKFNDDAILCWISSSENIRYPQIVSRVYTDTGASTDAEPDPVPNIIVF